MLNITMLGSVASLKTMGISFAVSYFGLQPIVLGVIVSLSRLVGVSSLFSNGHIGKLLMDTQMIIGGMSIIAVGTISFAWLQEGYNLILHYIVATCVIYGLGYPVTQSAIAGLFSKGT